MLPWLPFMCQTPSKSVSIFVPVFCSPGVCVTHKKSKKVNCRRDRRHFSSGEINRASWLGAPRWLPMPPSSLMWVLALCLSGSCCSGRQLLTRSVGSSFTPLLASWSLCDWDAWGWVALSQEATELLALLFLRMRTMCLVVAVLLLLLFFKMWEDNDYAFTHAAIP